MATEILTTTTSAHKELIQKLIDCALTCEMCEAACLNEDNITLLARCIELDRDCADICMLASRLVHRDSEVVNEYLAVCELVCRACAEECSKHHHEHCQTCAEVCIICADACRSMVKGGVA